MKKKRSKESRAKTSEALRRYHANKTDEQKKRVSRRMSKAAIERFECMTDAECKAYHEKRTKQVVKHYKTKAGDKTRKLIGKKSKIYQASLSPEQKAYNLGCRVAGFKKFLANLTPEAQKAMHNKRTKTNRGFSNYEEVEIPRVNDYSGVLTEDQLETV